MEHAPHRRVAARRTASGVSAGMMKIVSMRTVDGPNVFTYRPVVVTTVDLEELHERESREVPGFNERLLEQLPGLREHVCGKGYPGGFVERLRDGTYFGHVVEHVAIELGSKLGVAGNYGKTVRSARPHCFDLVVESRVHAATQHLIRGAVAGVAATVAGQPWDVAALTAETERIIAGTDLGPSTRAIVEAAVQRGIPWTRLNDQSLVQLGYGCHRRLIQSAMSDTTSGIAVEIAQDKALTKELLERAFIPVPRGETVETLADALNVFDQIGGPVVVKPLDGNQGKGVSVGMRTAEEVTTAFAAAQQYSSRVLVEETFTGDDYRVLVVGGRMVAASRRRPPCVVGDGRSTVVQLVAVANEDPRRGAGHEKPLTRVQIDDTVIACLAKQELSPESIPADGREVLLRENANLSTGGTAADVTDQVHPEVRAMCQRAARVIGMDICGVDLVLADIGEPPRPGGGIVELNAAPGIRMHLHPSSGEPREVGVPIVDMLFRHGSGRIPLIATTGTNGKTTVTRMIAHAIGSAGKCVGMTTTDGVWMDGRPVATGDMTGPRSAQAVLSDPAVEVAVLETARGGIVRSGLGYDWSDIGIITNIQLDHIGQDGIESIEDLAHIKSLVAERVREGGCLVFNADDDHVMRLLDEPRIARPSRELRLFSLYPNHFRVRRHLGGGGIAYVPRNGWIIEYAGSTQRRIIEVGEIPVALGGAAQFQLANAMAAAAACRAFGLAPEQIAAALSSFNAESDNQGRGNLYRVGPGYGLLDYGHNPAALEAVGRMGARWFGRRFTGVVGVPGDRADTVIAESARVAAEAFHRIIVREDNDLRGRRRGEIPRLLCEAISRRAPARPCRTVVNEANALRTALDTMEDNEVIVVFYEDLSAVRSVLTAAGATPATRVDPLQIGADGVFRELRRA